MLLEKLSPLLIHYSDIIMGADSSRITNITIVYSTVYSSRRSKKTSKHRWPVNFPHKWPVTRKMFPFDDVIIYAIRENVTFVDLVSKKMSPLFPVECPIAWSCDGHNPHWRQPITLTNYDPVHRPIYALSSLICRHRLSIKKNLKPIQLETNLTSAHIHKSCSHGNQWNILRCREQLA